MDFIHPESICKHSNKDKMVDLPLSRTHSICKKNNESLHGSEVDIQRVTKRQSKDKISGTQIIDSSKAFHKLREEPLVSISRVSPAELGELAYGSEIELKLNESVRGSYLSRNEKTSSLSKATKQKSRPAETKSHGSIVDDLQVSCHQSS